MTDPEFADATYIEPITPEAIEQILIKEKPDAVLATLGGQTALNAAMGLHEKGILEKHGVKLIGADVAAIHADVAIGVADGAAHAVLVAIADDQRATACGASGRAGRVAAGGAIAPGGRRRRARQHALPIHADARRDVRGAVEVGRAAQRPGRAGGGRRGAGASRRRGGVGASGPGSGP